MESSDDDDDFPSHEWITPQSEVNSIYQSDTEKGIRKLCSELLDLKDAVENLHGNVRPKSSAYLRLSEEVMEVEHEMVELHKHISAQGILVQDLISGVCHELETWIKWDSTTSQSEESIQKFSGCEDPFSHLFNEHSIEFLETLDLLLVDHKVDEALSALLAEEKSLSETLELKNNSSTEVSSYKADLLKRKSILVDQFVAIAEQPSASIGELKEAVSGLIKLGEGLSAHKFFLKAFESRIYQNIQAFFPLCLGRTETYAATLSQLVFSTISWAAKESRSIFGDVPKYTSCLQQWVEQEVESFVHLVKENGPASETTSALWALSICMQASLTHCSIVEGQGLKISKLLMTLLCPYFEEILDMNFKRAVKMVLSLVQDEDIVPLAHQHECQVSPSSPKIVLTSSGKRFMMIVKDIVEPLTQIAIFHFGGATLQRLHQLFDKYVETLIQILPGLSEDDNFTEPRELMHFRAETDAQQLALLGTAFAIADELLPTAAARIFYPQTESRESGSGPVENGQAVFFSHPIEYKDWRRQLQHSVDKLRDHFCRQYVLSFIYSREGKTRLDAWIYLEAGDDHCDSDHWLPSLPFQALFARLQQLAIVAGDVLLGREKVQKILLTRLTETVVMWLSDEQEFWGVLEDESTHLHSLGLQQLILDMHFIVEIMVYGGYTSKHVHQIASSIIERTIQTFSAKGIKSSLPKEEWFVSTAKASINRLLLYTSGSDMPVEAGLNSMSDSDNSVSSLSSESADTFVSANMEETESPEFLLGGDG